MVKSEGLSTNGVLSCLELHKVSLNPLSKEYPISVAAHCKLSAALNLPISWLYGDILTSKFELKT